MKKIILGLLLLTPFLGVSQVDSSSKTEEFPPKEGTIVEKTVEPEVFQIVEQMPEFPGGQDSMNKFISRNLVYPIKAIEGNVQGTVHVQFIVEENGNCSNIRIMKGIGSGCDEEVIRMIKMMPPWQSGMQRGKTVRVIMRLPFKFKLN